MRRNNQQGVALSLPSGPDAVALVTTGTIRWAKRHPKTTSFYVLGLLVALLATGSQLTSVQKSRYNEIMATVDTQLEHEVVSRYNRAYNDWYRSKGWFSCDSYCTRMKRRMTEAKVALDEVKKESNARISDAKATAGVFSEVGVGEVRDSFWDYFNRGTKLAKRQTMMDALFSGFRSMYRDESWGEYLLKMLLQLLTNFTVSLSFAFVMFVFGLYSIVKSYQVGFVEGAVFILLAVAAGFATVTTVLGAMFGTAGAAVYTMGKIAEAQQLLDQGSGGGRRRVRNGRLHQD